MGGCLLGDVILVLFSVGFPLEGCPLAVVLKGIYFCGIVIFRGCLLGLTSVWLSSRGCILEVVFWGVVCLGVVFWGGVSSKLSSGVSLGFVFWGFAFWVLSSGDCLLGVIFWRLSFRRLSTWMLCWEGLSSGEGGGVCLLGGSLLWVAFLGLSSVGFPSKGLSSGWVCLLGVVFWRLPSGGCLLEVVF